MNNTEYTNNLTAEELIAYIANQYIEMSLQPAYYQRNDIVKSCQEWLKANSVEDKNILELKND